MLQLSSFLPRLPRKETVENGLASALTIVFSGAIFSVAPGYAGTLTGSFVPGATQNVDLSAAGISEWAVWGQGASTSLSPTDKSLDMTAISNLTAISNGSPLRGIGQFGNYGQSTFNWSNGTVNTIASNVFSGLQLDSNINVNAVGEGFSLDILATPGLSHLQLYTTAHVGHSSLVATLSDNSAPPLRFDTTILGGNRAHTFNISFQPDSNATLNLEYLLSQRFDPRSNVAIQGVAVTFPTPPAPGPLPIFGLASAFSMSRRLRLRRRIASTLA